MRQKIDYGIDLGTTNSAIARMDAGEAIIIKSDDNQMDTTPSCVFFNKKRMIFVGLNAKNAIETEAASEFRSRCETSSNGYLEFKRTMGTDHQYKSANMGRAFSSEELSSEVLKKLRSYIRDEEVGSVVITVPAMFKQNQIDATQRAAELAGFRYCELLQEPIAASIAYGIKANANSGHWLVFDLGGGTFDAALMHVEDGIMKVVDTEGDNHLGGKNIDAAIVDQLLIPEIAKRCTIDRILSINLDKKLLQDALKRYAEQAKIAFSSRQKWEHYLEELGSDDNGEPMEVDLTISLEQYETVSGPLFQKAIDICKALLSRNGLRGDNLSSIILVGGPTFSQTLRRMLKEQVTPHIDTSVDPMTAVAKGAALFASTKNIPIDFQKRDSNKVQLTLKYPETTVETHENLGIRIDRSKSTANLPVSFSIEVIRSDRGWSSGKIDMDGDTEVVEVFLNDDKANLFDIKLFGSDGSIIQCEPSSITIIHGLKIANPTLPYAIGLELYNTLEGKEGVYPVPGLEKNKTLPAKGKGLYKTAKDIRPGNRSDKFTVPFYEISYGDVGSPAIYNNLFGGATVTGEQLPAMLPAQSEVELTLRIDASRRASLSIFIPQLDETIEVQFESSTQKAEDVDALLKDVEQAREMANKLKSKEQSSDMSDFKSDLDEVEHLLNNRSDDVDTKVLARQKLQQTFIALDKIESENKWPEMEANLESGIEQLILTVERYGNDQARQMLEEYKKRLFQVKSKKDLNAGKQLLDELFAFSFSLIQNDIGLWLSWIKDYDQNFETIEWTDKREARRVLDDAKKMIAINPSKTKVEGAVCTLWSLMPKEKREADKRASDELLRK
ncbi:MAG: Hsp70 family protein [Chlorobiaceae bacterium]|nr:Hsp70 family protein [Chlorobiaceae bacterium]